ncbi:MAG TPA: replicative DNA helicase [Synergistales bacterium]|nr:replicative DNA helicase [Synergistales bacterium]
MSDRLFERIPPHSIEAERAVLGDCLLDQDALTITLDYLLPDDFYDGSHRKAFSVMREMAEKGKPVDPLTFLDELSRRGLVESLGGQAFIAGFVDSVPTTANVEYHVRIVRDKSVHRRLIQVGAEIARLGYSEDRELEEVLDEAERSVFEISQRGSQVPYRRVGDVLGPAFHEIEEKFHSPDSSVTGIPSGFSDFERLTGGFQPGSLNIIAARPSMGKTALALDIAMNASVERDIPVLMFSLEMGSEQLVQRMLGSRAKVNIHDLRTGMFHENAWGDLAQAAGDLSRAPFYIDDSSVLSTLEMRARCRRLKSQVLKTGGGLIVVDYLQLMQFSRRIESKQQEVAEISRSLKAIARELDVPVIALSQLSRAVESRNEKRPQLSDLRDSGAIEQDADLVVLLYRSGYYESAQEEDDATAEVIIAKHRNGPTGTVRLTFFKEHARFANQAWSN